MSKSYCDYESLLKPFEIHFNSIINTKQLRKMIVRKEISTFYARYHSVSVVTSTMPVTSSFVVFVAVRLWMVLYLCHQVSR